MKKSLIATALLSVSFTATASEETLEAKMKDGGTLILRPLDCSLSQELSDLGMKGALLITNGGKTAMACWIYDEAIDRYMVLYKDNSIYYYQSKSFN